MFWPDPTHQNTHPSTHPPNYTPPMGGEAFTDFKSSNRIEISGLVQVLLNFDWFWGSPLGVGVGERVPPHMCTWTRMHIDVHAYDIIGNPPNWGCHLQLKLSCLTCICVCMCMHACTCMCMCVGGIPQPSPNQSTHPPPPKPQGAQNTKIQEVLN